jgi:proline iminopeptidase
MHGTLSDGRPDLREGHVPVDGTRLYYRVLGGGPPMIVLHGGPNLDHAYLLPELDRLAESFRLVYYDQRGRGRSSGEVEGLRSEMDDLDRVRRHFGLDSVALLGHSWGALLAMEYATRHPDRVSQLVLANAAPGSADGFRAFRENLRRTRPPEDTAQLKEIAASAAYRAGELDAEDAFNRIYFRPTLGRPEQLEALVARLRTHFTPPSVLAGRAIAQRLHEETADAPGYDLTPRLRALEIPALVLHGEHDFIPVALAARIAKAMPRARLVVLERCGHFAYLERPRAFHEHVTAALGRAS